MLGSGTSTGVPVIGCDCPVCTSDDPRNRRLRTALRVDVDGTVLLIDTPPDLRCQALRFGLPRLDAILFTHAHADHVHGLDDVRIFNFRQRETIPCFGAEDTLRRVRQAFAYVFETATEGGGRPRLELIPVIGPFDAAGVPVIPVPVWHGSTAVLGYRIGDLAYVTDVNRIPDESFERLEGLEVLILGALRYRRHSTHYSIGEAIEVAQRIGARRTVLTHLTHEVDHSDLEIPLPAGMELGYDGLLVDLG